MVTAGLVTVVGEAGDGTACDNQSSVGFELLLLTVFPISDVSQHDGEQFYCLQRVTGERH